MATNPLQIFPPGTAAIDQKYANLITRQDVVQFFYPPSVAKGDTNTGPGSNAWKNDSKDLFLQGLAGMLNAEPEDPWSFFAIGGIHGQPNVPYDGDDSTEWTDFFLNPAKHKNQQLWWGGYCHHGDILFPTWHRPYVLLFENAIIHWALQVVNDYNWNGDDSGQQRGQQIAQSLRLPYLDWAGSYVRVNGLPSIFTDTTVKVKYPATQEQKIANPLKSFTLPRDIGTLVTSGEFSNPIAKPYYQVPTVTPFLPRGYATVRYPTPSYTSDNHGTQEGIMRGCNLNLRQQLYASFSVPEWGIWSNHLSSKDGQTNTGYGHYSSIEVVHDMVHDFIGGPGGTMAYPDLAGLDPIFFFHHCNVDRILALWQYIYDPTVRGEPEAKAPADRTYWIPTSPSTFTEDGTFYEKPGDAITQDTELRPFRIKEGADTKWFTSKDVRSVQADLNYSYPELDVAKAQKWTAQHMLNYVLQLYKPMRDVKYHWYVNIENIPKNLFSDPWSIRVFIDDQDATSETPLTDPHYAGSIFVFARSGKVKCKNCKPDTKISGSVDITDTMLHLNIVTAPEIDENLGDVHDPNSAAEPSSPFYDGSIKLVYVAADGKTPLPVDKFKSDPPTFNVTWALDLGNTLQDVFNPRQPDVGTKSLQAGQRNHPVLGEWRRGKHFGVANIAHRDNGDSSSSSSGKGKQPESSNGHKVVVAPSSGPAPVEHTEPAHGSQQPPAEPKRKASLGIHG